MGNKTKDKILGEWYTLGAGEPGSTGGRALQGRRGHVQGQEPTQQGIKANQAQGNLYQALSDCVRICHRHFT